MGQIGTDFRRSLGTFYNTFNYQRDIVDQTEYFGSIRYAVGPHIGLFGGVLFGDTSLSQPALKVNDNQRKSVELGVVYTTGASSSFDFDYRYTDARYSHSLSLNGVQFDPDYKDETARVTFKDALTDKTQIEALLGYLKRSYPNTAIGSFSGKIWRVTVEWHPTDKTAIIFAASRDLQADLGAQTDYFVTRAVSIGPTWTPTEKLTLSLVVLRDQQEFLGTNQFVISQGTREDLVKAGQVNVAYTPLVFAQSRTLTVNLAYRRENRSSNQARLSYDDNLARAGVTFKF